MAWTEDMLVAIKRAGVKVVASVPDNWVAPLLALLDEEVGIAHAPTSREEEAVGVCCGAALAGRRALYVSQNVGVLNSGGALTTLAMAYGVPFVLLIADRGRLGDTTIAHVEKGRVSRPFLNNLGIRFFDLAPDFLERDQLGQAFVMAEAGQKPVALLTTRATLGLP